MIETDWRDMTWYSHPKRAGGRALEMSEKAAESMMVIQDTRTNLFGVGVGRSEPSWCAEKKGFRLIAVIHPREN